MSVSPMQNLTQALRQHGLVRFIEHYAQQFPDAHLKDVIVDHLGAHREMEVAGQRVINFGSDSFLGLDQDPRFGGTMPRRAALGAHNGASRAFASVRTNEVAEEKLANWLGTEATLIYPSVTLANLGDIPGLVSKRDLLVIDEHAHNSMQEGAKIAQANGVRVIPFSHCDPDDLERTLATAGEYRVALVAIDGVYSMTAPCRRLPSSTRFACNATPSFMSMTPTAPPSSAAKDAAPCLTLWAITITPWWSARFPKVFPVSAASSPVPKK